MEESHIVPDVIDIAPTDRIQVYYYGGLNVNFGNELTPRQVKNQPTVKWEADPSNLHTLFMLDPDATILKEKNRQILHWLVGNIPGNNLEKGEIISTYVGSAPRPAGVIHRYVFLVYKQNGSINFNEEKIKQSTGREARLNFCVREFTKNYNLGDPVAGNFYTAQYDDYVAELIASQNK